MTTSDYLFRRIKIPSKRRLTEMPLPRSDKSSVPNLTLNWKKEKVYLWKPDAAVWWKAEMEYWKAVLYTPARGRYSPIIYCPYWKERKDQRVELDYASIRTSKFMLKLAAVGQLLTLHLPKSRKT